MDLEVFILANEGVDVELSGVQCRCTSHSHHDAVAGIGVLGAQQPSSVARQLGFSLPLEQSEIETCL